MDSLSEHILVTGGGGFIGSHLVDLMISRGAYVTVVDDFSTGRMSNLERAQEIGKDRLRIVKGSVSEMLCDLNPSDFGFCYHLAAAVGVRLVMEQPIHTIETNVQETASLLSFVSQTHIPTLLASTSEVYGKGSSPQFSEDDDVVYGPTTCNRWSYATSKAIDEFLGLAHCKEGKAPVVVARFFNTVGPRQVGQYGMVLPRFVDAAMKNQPIHIHGNGTQSRCFCDVRDVVPAIMSLLEHSENHGRVFNVGSDQSITITELAELVKARLKSSSVLEYVPYSEVYGGGMDDLKARMPNLSRIREAIGFAPEIHLDKTIDDLAAERECREVNL